MPPTVVDDAAAAACCVAAAIVTLSVAWSAALGGRRAGGLGVACPAPSPLAVVLSWLASLCTVATIVTTVADDSAVVRRASVLVLCVAGMTPRILPATRTWHRHRALDGIICAALVFVSMCELARLCLVVPRSTGPDGWAALVLSCAHRNLVMSQLAPLFDVVAAASVMLAGGAVFGWSQLLALPATPLLGESAVADAQQLAMAAFATSADPWTDFQSEPNPTTAARFRRPTPVGLDAHAEVCERLSNVSSELTARWRWSFAGLAAVRLVYEALSLIPSLLIRSLIDHFEAEQQTARGDSAAAVRGLCVTTGLVAAMVMVNVVGLFLRSQYALAMQKMATDVRGRLSMAVFDVVFHARRSIMESSEVNLEPSSRNTASAGRTTKGQLASLLTVDAYRITDQLPSINDLWALPFQATFALYLLYVQVSVAFFAGLAIALVLVPVNIKLARKITAVNRLMMAANDERSKRVTESLQGIAFIVQAGWCDRVVRWIAAPRAVFMQHLRWVKLLDGWCVFFWATTPLLVPFATFALYAFLLSREGLPGGASSSAGTVLAAMSLFNALITPLNAFPWVINGCAEALVSKKRLESFFRSISVAASAVNAALAVPAAARNSVPSDGSGGGDEPPVLRLQDVTFLHRVTAASGEGDFHLDVKSFHACFGELVVVVGPPASGKTMLVNALAGECFIARGSVVQLPFCCPLAVGEGTPPMVFTSEQPPFLLPASILENITLRPPSATLRTVDQFVAPALEAVALTEEFGVHRNVAATMVTDGGAGLSGGQQTRVCLARLDYRASCIPPRRTVWLLDDPVSNLDPRVAQHVVRHCLVRAARDRSACVVVVTSRADSLLLPHAHRVYEIVDSTVVLSSERWHATPDVGPPAAALAVESQTRAEPTGTSTSPAGGGDIDATQQGRVNAASIRFYFRAVGAWWCMVVVASLIAMQAARNYSDWYVAAWAGSVVGSVAAPSSNTTGDPSASGSRGTASLVANVNEFLSTYAVIVGVNLCVAFVRSFSFSLAGLSAARTVHDTFVQRLFSSTLTSVQRLSVGRIISRCTRDVYVIDDSLPFTLNIVMAQLFLLMGALAIIFAAASWITVGFLLPALLLYYLLQRPYRKAGRELKRQEAAARAPVLDALMVVAEGGVTLRAAGRETLDEFRSWSTDRIEHLQVATMRLAWLTTWFGIRLQVIGAGCLLVVGVAVSVAAYLAPPADGSRIGTAGLALTYVSPLTGYLAALLSAFTELEKMMVSVERVGEVVGEGASDGHALLEPEPTMPPELQSAVPPGWPRQGAIDISNLRIAYPRAADEKGNHCAPPVTAVMGVSLAVAAGERVALVGRSGSGKTTLLQAILRLVPFVAGSVCIDGIDILSVDPMLLRSRIGVVTQSPCCFSGTVRTNIDPFDEYSDAAVAHSLRLAGLPVMSLDADVVEAGHNLSRTQRMLLSVARVLLQDARIVLLDEPCASMDDAAERGFYESLRSAACWRDKTVLLVSHGTDDALRHLLVDGTFHRVVRLDRGEQVVWDGDGAASAAAQSINA